jgi:hypothetical protein
MQPKRLNLRSKIGELLRVGIWPPAAMLPRRGHKLCDVMCGCCVKNAVVLGPVFWEGYPLFISNVFGNVCW